MSGKMTQEEFIAKCKESHGDSYDYSKTYYSGALKKVTITCKKHGDFEQFASHHSYGRGCKKCSDERKVIGTEAFIERAKKLHGDTYDYSKVEYVSATEKVILICKKHGEFMQTPDKHLQGHGCSICAYGDAINWSNDQDGFRFAANKTHNGKYDYSKSLYKRSIDKVEIVCPEHGSFWQSPNTHLQGIRCPVCAGNSFGQAKSSFIGKAVLVHGDKYDYSKTNYIGAHSKVTVTCLTHGDFEQSAGSHLSGSGCPSCSKTGFDKNKPATFYIYRIDGYLGYGISNKFKNRHKQHKVTFRKNLVSWELIHKFSGHGFRVLECENYVKNNFDGVGCSLKGFLEENTSLCNLSKLVEYLNQHLTTEESSDTRN